MPQRINGTGVPQDMDRLSVMRRVLEGLPETTLIVFMAHRVEGKHYAVIAREMGISEWRVERHMVRVIERIADVGGRYRAAFSALDPVSRHVLELAWDGLSHDRIAVRLGLSLHEVETRLVSALVALQRATTPLVEGCRVHTRPNSLFLQCKALPQLLGRSSMRTSLDHLPPPSSASLSASSRSCSRSSTTSSRLPSTSGRSVGAL